MAADWSLLQQQPNLVGNIAAGYQAGQALGKQKRLDAALGQMDLTKPETLIPVIQADPTTGLPLLTASSEMAKAQHETAGRVAAADYLTALLGNHTGAALRGPSTSSPNAALGGPASDSQASAATAASPSAAASGSVALTAPTSPTPAPGSTSSTPSTPSAPGATDSSGEIVVNAPTQPTQLEQARANFIREDPENYLKFETAIAGMTKAQRDSYDGTLSLFDGMLQGVKTIPESDQAGRAAYIQAHRDHLIQAGVPADTIDGFVPTDANITSQDNQVLGAKGVIERQDKDRSFGLQQDQFGETQRHNRADESNSAANAATSRGQLSISQRRLTDEETGKIGTNGSTKPTAAPRYEYRVGPGGKVQKRAIQ